MKKRSYDEVARDASPSYSISSRSGVPSPTQQVPTSDVAQGKQRRLSFDEGNTDCTPTMPSSRPRALPSSSRATFVSGLQTFVGGLQMSQDSSLARAGPSSSRTTTASTLATRHSIDVADAPQPLMMSRNADSERRASQTAARRRSEEDVVALVRRTSLTVTDPQLVPGVSPGWHVEAHGSQAMELQEGVRFQDEDGWTPLDAFPAATRQGKLAVKRVKLRRQQEQQRKQRQPAAIRTHASSSTPSILVDSPSRKETEHSMLSDRAYVSSPHLLDVEMTEESAIATPDPAVSNTSPLLLTPQQSTESSSASCSTSPATLSSASSPAPSRTLSLPFDSRDDDVMSKLGCDASAVDPRPPAHSKAYTLSDFEVIETLGTGTFGRVLLVRLRSRHIADRAAYFALKVLAKSDVVKLKQVAHLNSERSILTKVDHPFLVNMIASFQDSKNCYMLMEYVVGGEIFSYLRRAGQFSADVARFYISTIVLALEYLHKNKVVYRDLKPENLLVDSNGYTKITDFGFAKEVEERTWTLCGTPEYLAPEIIQCSGHGTAVDWWSLGILLFEMLAGYPPFYDPNPILIYEKILAGKLVFPEQIDPVSRDLISSLLTVDRSRRLGNLRGGSADVKNHAWFQGVDWNALQEGRIRPPIVPYLGQAGDTSNFSKYEPARPSALPGLFGTDGGHEDPHANLFPDF